MKEHVRYYRSYEQEFTENAGQGYTLPEDYRWIRTDVLSKIKSFLIYTAALIFSVIYCRIFLHIRFCNRGVLRQAQKTGAFLYGNHTQSVGDVFTPALLCYPGRIYTIASAANLGIPFLGRLLPYLGALPLSGTPSGMKDFSKALCRRAAEGHFLVVYPEAHVWDYYTGIRPFSPTSFRYPVKCDKPVYAFTSVYRQRHFGKKPAIEVWLDGPFYADKRFTEKENAVHLRDRVADCLYERSRRSNAVYIDYRPEP